MKRDIKASMLLLIWIAASISLLTGCSVKSLEKAKELANQQDFAALAVIDANCYESSEGCNQLHLLKGDACCRLASKGQEPRKHYACAATELAEGIRLTSQWQTSNLDRPQVYTNLSESLLRWRNLSEPSEAEAINDRLLKTAQQFLAVEPGNGCANYYASDARYVKLHACLLHPEQCPSLCGELKAILQSLDEGLAKTSGTQCNQPLKATRKKVAADRDLISCP